MAALGVKSWGESVRSGLWVAIFVCCGGMWIPVTAAAEGCAACSDEARFVEPEAVLELNGMSGDAFTLVTAWQESPRGTMVQGMRVRVEATGDMFDVYSDGNGRVYSDSEVVALGIAEKDWTPKNVSKLSEQRTPSLGAQALRTPLLARSMSAEVVTLETLDYVALLLEDEAEANVNPSGPARIGVFQELELPIEVGDGWASDGTWSTLADGSAIWAVMIESPGAVGQRVHFSTLDLPKGAEVVVYNATDPEEIYGPFPGPHDGSGDIWAPTVFGEAVVVECVVPAELVSSPLAILIERTAHVYEDLRKSASEKVAGSCNLDVTCYPEWEETSRGIVGLGLISSTGVLRCTGTLIADNNPGTDEHLLLSANHCFGIDRQALANSSEFFWFYQTSVCNGTPPAILDESLVPRTAGADFLFGSFVGSGTDVALLQLHEAPPAMATHVGWSTLPQATGTPTTCIHHPSRDFKRIAIGETTDVFDEDFCRQPIERFHQSTWSDGTTEPGSSGSPLFNSSQQIIGQLWGGCASCSNLFTPDYYGRFDLSFPMIQSFLESSVPEIDFNFVQHTVVEDQTMVSLAVSIDEVPASGITGSVDFTTMSATAIEGEDFVASSGTLFFSDSVVSNTVDIVLLDDEQSESDEEFTVILSNPVEFALAMNNNPSTVRILDDDRDTDGDGITDLVEGSGDFDHDGLPNFEDTDSDGDGIDDAVEGVGDEDGDALPNYIDLDSDADTIEDEVEGAGDVDGDSIPNYLDLDSDGDGLLDIVELANDADSDGAPDFLDVDSDGDGIGDATEGVVDSDNDGVADYLDTDSDADGLLDSVEGEGDMDGDQVPNYLDLDSDDDGILDSVEGADDVDSDLLPNFLDLDSDGDGISDATEGVSDSDADTVPDYLDTDSDGDGIPDSTEGVDDPDGDLAPNYLDLDSDGDGIADAVEGGGDTDNDGNPNYLDLDSDDDGIDDATEGVGDPDGDQIPNYLDGDSDGDGLSDAVEGTVDTDMGGTANYLDTDSDEDGIPDEVEGVGDPDGDMLPNYVDLDSDGDSILDATELTGDLDGDTVPNYLDLDSDGDGIPDEVEGTVDTDMGGMADYLDTDSDEDGIPDETEGVGDPDGDMLPNYRDLDSDGDTIGDAVEGVGDVDMDLTANYLDDDSDGDTLLDSFEGTFDTDGDGISNYLDVDSDDDGRPDASELLSDADDDDIPDYIDALQGMGDGFGRGGLLQCASSGSGSGTGRVPMEDFALLVAAAGVLVWRRRVHP